MASARRKDPIAEFDRCEKVAARRQRYTEPQLIGALQGVAFAKGKLTTQTYDDAYEAGWDIPTRAQIISRFGSWAEALHAAGFESQRRGPYRTRMPDEHLWDEVRRCANELSVIPTVVQYDVWARAHGAPCSALVRRRLGGWRVVVRELQKVA